MKSIPNQNNYNKQAESVRLVLNVFLGVWTVFVGVLFIVQVWRIFLSGGGFTVESVSAKFSGILFPFIVWVAAVVFSGVLALAFPVFEKPVAYIDPRNTLKKLKARLPENNEGRYELNARFVAWCIAFIIMLTCAIVAGVYLMSSAYDPVSNAGFFAEHEEAERIVRALPWIFAAFGVVIGVSFFERYSLRKEISLVKSEIAENAKKGVVVKARNKQKTAKETARHNERTTLFVRVAIGVVAIVFIVIGIANGGMADVLGKAINICTQCIGLG